MPQRILIACLVLPLVAGVAAHAASPSAEIGVEIHVSHAVERVDGAVDWQAGASVFGRLAVGSSWMVRSSFGSDLAGWAPRFVVGAVRQVTTWFAGDVELSTQWLPGKQRWIGLTLGARFADGDGSSTVTPRIIVSSFPLSIIALNSGDASGWAFQIAFAANLAVDVSWLVGRHARLGQAFAAAIIAPLPAGIDPALPIAGGVGAILTFTPHAGYVL